jgi:SAM-dependent methyltransferase
MTITGPEYDEGLNPEEGRSGTLHKKEFWSKENLKYSRPHYRLEKSARIVNRIVQTKACTLLDVGCGPAALSPLLRSNIEYYGVDIAIQDPAPNLLEADFLETAIDFNGKHFDIVLAQGVFEYIGTFQDQKFAEIAELLNDGGTFIVSYVNFDHRNRDIYWPYSNIQPFDGFRGSLARHFEITRCFPTSYNWNHREPGRKLVRAINMYVNARVPIIGHRLAVEYFFICSSRSSSGA